MNVCNTSVCTFKSCIAFLCIISRGVREAHWFLTESSMQFTFWKLESRNCFFFCWHKTFNACTQVVNRETSANTFLFSCEHQWKCCCTDAGLKAKSVTAWILWAPDETLTCASSQLKWVWGDACIASPRRSSEFQWSFLFPLSPKKNVARIWSALLCLFIHSCWRFRFLNFWSAGSIKKDFTAVWKGEKIEMICTKENSLRNYTSVTH